MDLGLEALSKVTEHTNKCPKCGRVRYFKSRAGLLKSNRLGISCISCANSIKQGGKGAVLNEKGERFCVKCETYKEESQFYPGMTSFCIPCSNEKSLKYGREVYRYSRHGLTKEEFEQMLDNQQSKCLICEKELDGSSHVDHCHKSGKVRGILCGKCNKGLGQFGDDIELMKKAIKYLEIYG